MRGKLAAGNWKMNGGQESLKMIAGLADEFPEAGCDIVICPPAHLLGPAVALADSGPVEIGAQNCHFADKGAHTGDISATMLRDAGARYIIVGHSERREAYAESDAQVRSKASAAQAASVVPIVCLGESLEQREAGEALPVIRAQLRNSVPDNSTGDTLVVAYEPIWAIGTGKIPSMAEIAEVHAILRSDLMDRLGSAGEDVRLLYGGSVKASNAQEIFAIPNVDGALVGGASLTAEDFGPIVGALANA